MNLFLARFLLDEDGEGGKRGSGEKIIKKGDVSGNSDKELSSPISAPAFLGWPRGRI